MKKSGFVLIAITVLFIAGCSVGIRREKISQLLEQSSLSAEYTETVPDFLGKTAVWMNLETLNSRGELTPVWRWTKQDLDIANSYLNSLVKEKKISGFYFVKTSQLKEKTLDGLIEKTDEDTDTAIVIKTIVELDKYFNPAAILDLTIIGAYWIPGSNRDAYAKTRIEIIDLKTKRLMAHFDGEAFNKITKPTFLINSEKAVSKAKSDSLRNALRELYKKVSKKTNPIP